VQEIEGQDFPGALKILADRAGVEIKRESSAVKSDKDKLFAVLQEATSFFESKLKEQKEVIEYLKKRGTERRNSKKI